MNVIVFAALWAEDRKLRLVFMNISKFSRILGDSPDSMPSSFGMLENMGLVGA